MKANEYTSCLSLLMICLSHKEKRERRKREGRKEKAHGPPALEYEAVGLSMALSLGLRLPSDVGKARDSKWDWCK